MLTPQEVSARSFTKAVMGGYNMTMVDEFLDELTDDYTALYKENASLKAKLKVLVEKVEEYRATEDSMRATLLTAQRMADSIVKEAEERRDEILGQAEASARERLGQFRRELAEADQRLRQGQLELQRFISASRALCAQELQFLDRLPELEIAPEQTEEKMEEQVRAAFTGKPAEVPDPFAPPAAEPAEPVEKPDEKTERAEQMEKTEKAETVAPVEKTGEELPDLDATRRVNLNDLKFGRNYSKDG